ncbi:Casein kinase I homolog hhp2 OS=Schizosaccharomyces pombe (strain 972 / ATCC 24843) GN=hhp2 PE=2 SV=2 [Rhizoctonia solani AG-1 IB]|uniref:non-specific serine/threonine protein kinase n=1 Tax=Thanatephorus cucumeris (strain AG1-IB / isolate 7/3/14) TaxID=1108050 RepID=A0A0B7F3D7_THACB|nr:Casein kinase I homolog hhp2 OS=Schizosaccharomyces pombe (strain 972 / ATCC 24843) GN=hhp2 PE=2 SV=2 [Rhizoctonia solani AG-1 IB]
MQLLYKSLEDLVTETGPLHVTFVLKIADQMLSVLDHMHNKGLVHRDIKPSNILVKSPDSWQLCLIDFGLAYRPRPLKVSQLCHQTTEDFSRVFGTTSYASLEAHRVSELTFRDDLESLAYTLIFLLRGSLPWSAYLQHGSIQGRIRQVYKQKQRHDGQRLALGLPFEFGMLVDCARSLSRDELPNYSLLRTKLQECSATISTCISPNDRQAIRNVAALSRPPPPAQPGQLIIARMLPDITVEGHSSQIGHEESYIHDPSLMTSEWSTVWRPGVIVDVDWDELTQLYFFTAVAICRLAPECTASDTMVPFSTLFANDANAPSSIVLVEPEWALANYYCYVYKDPAKFYFLRSQQPVPTRWAFNSHSVDYLRTRLGSKHDIFRQYDMLHSSDPDTRHSTRMRSGHVKIYAEVHDLSSERSQHESMIDWLGTRAWFDECVKACRHRDLENRRWWTGASFGKGEDGSNSTREISDSYRGSDHSLWDIQQERNTSITLHISAEPTGSWNIADELGEIDLDILVE